MNLFLKIIRFGLGFPHSHFYLVVPNQQPTLFTSNEISYSNQQALATEHYAIVQKVASYAKPIVIAGLSLQRRYLQSILDSDFDSEFDEGQVKRLIALPVQKAGNVFSVLIIEDHKDLSWNESFVQTIKLMCSALALCMDPLPQEPSPQLHKKQIPLRFQYHKNNEVLFLNESPFIKNLPAKILTYILHRNLNGPGTTFSNQEVICALQDDFPSEGKINFEARLSLVKKRLESKGLPLRIVSHGRGQFMLILDPHTQYELIL